MKQILKIMLIAAVLVVAACANNPNRRAGYGAGIGAGAGAALGYGIGGDVLGTLVGSAVGALAGAGVGHYLDAQQQELQKKLAKQRAAKELQVTKLGKDALKVGIAGDASFDVDSADIKPQFQSTYQQIASVLKKYPKSIVHVVGFTDNTGSDNYNLGLSQRRATSVANFLNSQGISKFRLMTEGRGESQPVADNSTPAGRKQNRRVAIVINPVVKGHKKEAYQPPPPLGRTG